MPRPAVLDQVAALSDVTRTRLLLVLESHELTVSELCDVLHLPQSTISRHLKLLADQGWLRSRRDGTKRFYQLHSEELGPTERRLWMLIRDSVKDLASSRQDLGRLRGVLDARRTHSARFFSSAAGRWDGLRRQLFGSHFDVSALLAMAHPDWVVGDLGCGTGQLSALLAPFVSRVIAVDSSEAMLASARDRLCDRGNVEIREGELESLPIEDAELDVATLFLVLHHVADPGRVVREAARALKPGGLLLLVDMLPHDREQFRQEMGHVWLGFERDEIERQLERAGLSTTVFEPLPVDPEARGPNLFVARGRARVRQGGRKPSKRGTRSA